MGKYARLASVVLALSLTRCDYAAPWFVQPGWQIPGGPAALLVCYGDFGQFANGFIVARPMVLHFIIDWATSTVTPTDGGSPAPISALSSAELAFNIQYEGYRIAYRLDRVTANFSQRPDLGGIFFGRCDLRPYTTKL